MFRDLLNATEKRHLYLLELFTSKGGWSFDSLSKAAECSLRTIKTDVKFLKDSFADLFVIQTSQNNQIRFRTRNPLAPSEAAMRMYKSNVHVQFLKIIFEEAPMRRTRYEELLHISSSTLNRGLKQINDLLSHYNIQITGQPYRIKGEEHHIRYFYSLFYWSIYHKAELPMHTEMIEKSEKFVLKIKRKGIIDVSLIVAEKISYFLSVSLYCALHGLIVPEFQSPFLIPREMRHAMELFLAQFPFPIPSSDMELLLFYFAPYYPDSSAIVSRSHSVVEGSKRTFTSYLEQLQKQTKFQLRNKEELINQLTVQYMYKSYFLGTAFLMGPKAPRNLLASLGAQYQPFIMRASQLLQEEFTQEAQLRAEEESAFVYWLITRWEGLADQIESRQKNKRAVLILSELGSQQEVFLENVLKNRLGARVELILHNQQVGNSERIEFILTDTFSNVIETAAPEGTPVIRMDYNNFEESIQFLEKKIAKKEQKEEKKIQLIDSVWQEEPPLP